MEMIEQFREAKTGNLDDCEDNVFFNAHFVSVVDGATNVSGQTYNGLTPGKLASKIIVDALGTLQGRETITEIIAVINATYKETYQALGMNDSFDEPYQRPSAAMIIYSKYHEKIWMIGDCQCYFNNQLHQNIKVIDSVFERARSIFVKAELMQGKSIEDIQKHDTSAQYIRPFIQSQYAFQNTSPEHSLSYGVVNGEPIPEELIVEVEVPPETDTISFGSDGYPEIYNTLEETEAELARVNKEDPLCIGENLGIKAVRAGNLSFDDRTYLKIKV